jgi:hypothetical protein
VAEEDPEEGGNGERPGRRGRGYRFRNQERRDTGPFSGVPAGSERLDEPGGDPAKYDLQEIDRRRNWVGDQIWRAVAGGNTNLLKSKEALSNFLAMLRPDWFPAGDHGVVDAKEKGRHMRRLFLGDLDEEGWGMGDNGYSRAVEEYKPNWRRMVEGMQRGADGLYFTDGGKYYDAFGRLVRTGPANPAPATPTAPVTPAGPTPPPSTTTTPSSPVAETTPPVNPAFYGGSTAPNPYGVGGPDTAMTRRQEIYNRRQSPTGSRPQGQTPGWYPTWRF